ncbi:ABC transporter permease [Flavobacterium sp. TMP13]|uniref:hypothetical protein n=1 Tax=unclassified Flavobacterium TaxID=196869 RepID=UPI00076CFA57|nr:hypothetical protein [Flavobacterium sp. TAB 87]KVV14361.1 hypothetical protein AP058_02253 [Flavobacterium sp. TAB 87]
MKPLQQLFRLKKVEEALGEHIQNKEEDREQIRITYYQSGFTASLRASGRPIVLRACLQNLFTNFKDQCSRQISEQQRLKQPFKEEQEKSRTELKKCETAIGIYEQKEHEIDKKIENAAYETVDVKVNPQKYIDDGKGGTAQFYIGLILLLPITLYLLVFYISASYSAFFKEFTDTSLTAAIFDADALTNAFKASWLEGVLVITIPFVFMGLGYVIHMMQKETGIKKTLRVTALFATTFLFDSLLAYVIEKKIYDFNKTPDSPLYDLEIALGQAEFWMIIFAGFVVYVIWGLVFDFVMKENENKDKIRVFIRGKKEEIVNFEKSKLENSIKILEFSNKIDHHKGEIKLLQSKVDGFVFPVKEYLNYHNQYKEGWFQAIGTEIALPNEQKHNLLSECDAIANEHLKSVDLVDSDYQHLIYSNN